MKTGFLAGIFALIVSTSMGLPDPNGVHQFTMKSIDGDEVSLEKYDGKVLLIVNVASKCGLTPQYEGLESLYEKYQEKGLVLLGFPCNQFNGQEPGSSEDIKKFCSTEYDVTFPLFEKIEVKGSNACDLYKFLSQSETKPKAAGDVSWNFEKFLVDRKGNVIARFDPRTKPDDAEFVKAIEAALSE